MARSSKAKAPKVKKKSLDKSANVQESEERRRPTNRRGAPTHVVNLRVPLQIVDDMDYLVERRQYKSRSEFVLAAIRFYLDYIEYREYYNVRAFQRGRVEEPPASRFERLGYLRASDKK